MSEIKSIIEYEVLGDVDLDKLHKEYQRFIREARSAPDVSTLSETSSNTKTAINYSDSQHIVDYKILRKKHEYTLQDEVKAEMKNGWVPFGGVSFAGGGMSPIEGTGNSFIQAMVKYED